MHSRWLTNNTLKKYMAMMYKHNMLNLTSTDKYNMDYDSTFFPMTGNNFNKFCSKHPFISFNMHNACMVEIII